MRWMWILLLIACAEAPPPVPSEYAAWAEANGMIAGATCRQGKLEELDAAYCEFADEAAAKAAEDSSMAWVGEAHAGAARASGKKLLVLADRGEKDPTGKRIDALLKAFK
jgi:hypothetical protein